MIQQADLGNVWVGHGVRWAGNTVQDIYRYVVAAWTAAGFPPDRICARAPGVGANYGSFQRKQQLFNSDTFRGMESLEVVCLENGRTNEMIDWAWHFLASRRQSTIVVSWAPQVISGQESCQLGIIEKLITLMGIEYGYMFQQQKALGPIAYALSTLYGAVGSSCQRLGDFEQNICDWDYHKVTNTGGGVLRDIYPENYLGNNLQQASIGASEQTLREWIEDDPAQRGKLEFFTDGLFSWKPPIQNIPVIREELYRAGRVFYWKFMQSQYFDPAGTGRLFDQPLYRPDLSAPWEADGPTPEVFTAEYYKDKDPGLVY